MALYGLIWLEIAFADNTSLPEHTREQISARIEQLLENPCQHGARPQGMLDLRWPVPGAQPFHVHEGTPRSASPAPGAAGWCHVVGCEPGQQQLGHPRLDRVARSREGRGCLRARHAPPGLERHSSACAVLPPEEFKY